MKDLLLIVAFFCAVWVGVGLCFSVGFNIGDWLCQ